MAFIFFKVRMIGSISLIGTAPYSRRTEPRVFFPSHAPGVSNGVVSRRSGRFGCQGGPIDAAASPARSRELTSQKMAFVILNPFDDFVPN
jgi:hypothetical protein